MTGISSQAICKHAASSKQLHKNPELCRSYVDTAKKAGGGDQDLFDTAARMDNQCVDSDLRYHMMAHVLCAGERDLSLGDKFRAVTEGVVFGFQTDETQASQARMVSEEFCRKTVEHSQPGLATTALATALSIASAAPMGLAGLALRCALHANEAKDPLVSLGKGLLPAEFQGNPFGRSANIGPEDTAFLVSSGQQILTQLSQEREGAVAADAAIAVSVSRGLSGQQALAYLSNSLNSL